MVSNSKYTIDDVCDTPFTIHTYCVQHGGRVIASDAISNVRLKGRRVLINHRGGTELTMIVCFKTKQDAEDTFNILCEDLYGEESYEPTIPPVRCLHRFVRWLNTII